MNACLCHTSEHPRGGRQRTADLCSYVQINAKRPAKKLLTLCLGQMVKRSVNFDIKKLTNVNLLKHQLHTDVAIN